MLCGSQIWVLGGRQIWVVVVGARWGLSELQTVRATGDELQYVRFAGIHPRFRCLYRAALLRAAKSVRTVSSIKLSVSEGVFATMPEILGHLKYSSRSVRAALSEPQE
ncbi:hypothetical protein Nepgr_004103 [Nepenthes gracilis]|uniref:Uncharacterized protein n=1 Tax=Nepenthes gracilis TaxID=150966 RepID=A0AAD3XEM2_NEPGR|nr:hypothetical protein Nepgr_004103 [Nepenthes gracilis]